MSLLSDIKDKCLDIWDLKNIFKPHENKANTKKNQLKLPTQILNNLILNKLISEL